MISAVVLALTGYAWGTYQNLSSGIKKSDVIKTAGGPKSINGDTNILIMGLDTRLDENGNPLPADIYNALHAGNQADGGNNSNVLMFLHVPGDGSKATALSIPRDDYVAFPGCPDQQCHGKIKQAYGLAFDQESKILANQGVAGSQREQGERDAGRKAEIATVSQFLGGVAIDHFVEVTLVAFFQIGQVVQPITVCLAENTHDSFSGANFHQGQQQISAAQALAFVRQRRDPNTSLNFTDLDRERRQQAFISSLAFQLKQSGTFTSPSKLSAILNVAKQNVAIDSGLDLLAFAQQASNLTSGNITFFTLPIDHFGQDSIGEDVNFVNLPVIQATVHHLLTPAAPATPTNTGAAPPPVTSAAPKPTAVVNVVNASARNGYAARVEQGLVAQGFTQGTASTQYTVSRTTLIYYGAGAGAAANSAETLLGGGIATQQSSAVAAGTLKIVIGTDFTLPASMAGATGGVATTTPPPATAVQATGGASPPPTALSALAGGGIPCVK